MLLALFEGFLTKFQIIQAGIHQWTRTPPGNFPRTLSDICHKIPPGIIRRISFKNSNHSCRNSSINSSKNSHRIFFSQNLTRQTIYDHGFLHKLFQRFSQYFSCGFFEGIFFFKRRKFFYKILDKFCLGFLKKSNNSLGSSWKNSFWIFFFRIHKENLRRIFQRNIPRIPLCIFLRIRSEHFPKIPPGALTWISTEILLIISSAILLIYLSEILPRTSPEATRNSSEHPSRRYVF